MHSFMEGRTYCEGFEGLSIIKCYTLCRHNPSITGTRLIYVYFGETKLNFNNNHKKILTITTNGPLRMINFSYDQKAD